MIGFDGGYGLICIKLLVVSATELLKL